MRVLVVDPDDVFAAEVIEHLGQAGLEAVQAASPDQMRAHMRTRNFQAILVDLSLRRMNGFDVARELRMQHPASELEIVLMSPRHKVDAPEIVSLLRDTEARFFYSKPLDLPALVSSLNTPLPESKANGAAVDAGPSSLPQARPKTASPVAARPATNAPKKKLKKKRKIAWENAKQIANLWNEKRTGMLTLSGDKAGSAAIVSGGLVDDAGRDLVKAALLDGVLGFEEGNIDGVGDWARLGRLMFKGARSGTDARTLRRYLSAIPVATEVTNLARILPLGDLGRRFVGRINGIASVAEILDKGELALGDVSRDVVTLVRLGLIELKREAEATEPKSRGPAHSARQALGRTAVMEAHAGSGDEQILSRLEREFATIQSAAPPVVLGIPADSERKLVDQAGARMRQRYAEIVARRDVSDDVRQIALEIAKRVDQAHRTFNFEAQISTEIRKASVNPADEIEQLLEQGRAYIGSKEWARADNVLATAHKRRIDHVPVLANLGWARLHNPQLDLDTRTEEGRDFLLLADEFDANDRDGQYFLAQVLLASNRLDAAELRAKRAVAAMPDDGARQTLLRKIKVLRAQAEDKAR